MVFMTKSNILKSFLSFALFFSIVFVLFFSCRRNKDCELVITVQDGTSNAVIRGASVHVYPSNGNLKIQDQTNITDGSGVARFTFKLPAILSVDVTPPAPFVSPPTTSVKVEEGKTAKKDITVY